MVLTVRNGWDICELRTRHRDTCCNTCQTDITRSGNAIAERDVTLVDVVCEGLGCNSSREQTTYIYRRVVRTYCSRESTCILTVGERTCSRVGCNTCDTHTVCKTVVSNSTVIYELVANDSCIGHNNIADNARHQEVCIYITTLSGRNLTVVCDVRELNEGCVTATLTYNTRKIDVSTIVWTNVSNVAVVCNAVKLCSTGNSTNSTTSRSLVVARSERCDGYINIASTVVDGCTICETYQTTVSSLIVVACRACQCESCVICVQSTSSRAVDQRACQNSNNRARESSLGLLDDNIGQLHILDVCSGCCEQWSCQALNLETFVATTIEYILAEVCDWSPLLTCHIDVSNNLSLGTRVECAGNLCELDKSLCAVDQVNILSVVNISSVDKLAELANCANIDRLCVAVELNGHLAVSCSVDSDNESAIRTLRNCNVNHLSLLAEYQALAASYGYGVRCALQSGQSTVRAVNCVRACDCSLLRLNRDACNLLAITLNSQTKHACEVVKLYRSLLLALSELSCVAVHRRCARSE